VGTGEVKGEKESVCRPDKESEESFFFFFFLGAIYHNNF